MPTPTTENNPLYPVFLKVQGHPILLVGGGSTAYEKLFFLLRSSPRARVRVVSKSVSTPVADLCARSAGVELTLRAVKRSDIKQVSVVIAAVNNERTNRCIRRWCTEQNTLLNVADTPELCDFYLGGIVTKGAVKIAISTNGRSPTLAKRLRQFFDAVLPEEISPVAKQLGTLRQQIQGDLHERIKTLDSITKNMQI